MHALHSRQTSYQASFCSNSVCISSYSWGFCKILSRHEKYFESFTYRIVLQASLQPLHSSVPSRHWYFSKVALVSAKLLRTVSTNRLLYTQSKSCEFLRNRTPRLMDVTHNHLFYFQLICPSLDCWSNYNHCLVTVVSVPLWMTQG